MLPKIIKMTSEKVNFPTVWQTVIYRNYRRVPSENIAKVIGCTIEDVEREAARLGLRTGECDPAWLQRGYITIFRNNWFILTYEQLMTLLDFDAHRFEFSLMNEDFLWVKLCRNKPECEAPIYTALTKKQVEQTETVAAIVRKYDTSERRVFDFFTDTTDTEPQYFVTQGGNMSIAHGFLSPCGDTFLEDSRSHLPDALLDAYAKQGVKSLFLHAVLSTLSPYHYNPELSRDYKKRRKNLKGLIDRAAKRGMKIFLYFNEPRAVSKDMFDKYGNPEIAGKAHGDSAVSLCLSAQEPKEYLYYATRDLFEELPDIGGIFTITMSENSTTCASGGKERCNCPRCKDIPVYKLPVLVNNIMHKAIRDAGSDAEVIAYTWAWEQSMGWESEDIERAMAELHSEIAVMHVSEDRMKLDKGGIETQLVDYSISNPGPSEYAKFIYSAAIENGHRCFAKVQVSCSWECAVVPYLPVFDLEIEHLENLHKFGVDDYMLTWTLGGYPSVTYDIISDYMKSPDTFDIEAWYKKQYGEDAEGVHRAVKLFCEGFKEYPFCGNPLYFSPKNLGPANLWSLTPNENQSAMISYGFDDVERYTKPYPVDIYQSQLGKLVSKWEEACEILKYAAHSEIACELYVFARFATLQYKSEIIHTNYVLAKRSLPESRDELLTLLKEEKKLILEQLSLMEKSPLIGYETSNHYFFTEREYIEKLLNLDGIEKQLAVL